MRSKKLAQPVPTLTLFLLFLAGFSGGFIDAVAGGGGLITMPALLACGLTPQMALGTNKLQSSCGTTLAVLRYGEINDPRMGHRVAFSAEGEINRKDFGLTMNMLVDGRWVVGDDVKISIELELVEQMQEAAAGASA